MDTTRPLPQHPLRLARWPDPSFSPRKGHQEDISQHALWASSRDGCPRLPVVSLTIDPLGNFS